MTCKRFTTVHILDAYGKIESYFFKGECFVWMDEIKVFIEPATGIGDSLLIHRQRNHDHYHHHEHDQFYKQDQDQYYVH